MSYVKDWFLVYAHRQCPKFGFDSTDNIEGQRQEAAADITAAYERDPELARYMICQKVYELANRGIMNGRIIYGVWNQLIGLLRAYHDGEIHDIGISAQITADRFGDNGAPISGESVHVHDRGDSRIHIHTANPELRRITREVLETINPEYPRLQLFERIESILKQHETPERRYTVELRTYLYIRGAEDDSLLKLSPNSFQDSGIHDDMEDETVTEMVERYYAQKDDKTTGDTMEFKKHAMASRHGRLSPRNSTDPPRQRRYRLKHEHRPTRIY